MIITIIGFLAVVFQSIRIIPQVIKGFTTKRVEDVSVWFLIIGSLGAVLWIVYGVVRNDWAIIIGNVLNLICYILLMFQKKLYRYDVQK